MKLSRNTLRDYVNIDVDTKTLAESMIKVGNEYDDIYPLVKATNLIIGYVKSCINHPDSDHLHVCTVDIGKCELEIVCGAPNVKEGIKVIVAQDGAVLPGGTIKKTTIRGIVSNGMLCSLEELGIESKYLSSEEKNGIHILDDDAKVGEDPIKYLELDDEIIDFSLTANRGDLLSILGMAYEVGAIYDTMVNELDISYKEEDEDIKNSLSLDIKTDNCSLFLAKKVKDIIIKESPRFIKSRLIASGIRPINNVVDISNYVMLITGQPLHFYDASRLGSDLVVRMASDNEKVTTLDNIERTLNSSDIVIANTKEAIGLAGVMGGLSTEVENDTTSIIIEAAIFDPIKVRLTSKKVLRSEASLRFEKGLDPKRTYMAINMACHLLESYASGKPLKGLLEYNNISIEDKVIEITDDRIKQVLGIEISLYDIVNVFDKLDFKTEIIDHKIIVTIPSRRTDISIKEDLIEEVGRIYGAIHIKGKLPLVNIKQGSYNKISRIIRNKMIGLGLNEVMTYTLIPESEVYKYTEDKFDIIKLIDPMTEDKSTLRHSIIPSLLNVYEYNKARGMKDIAIFELGTSFYKKDNNYFEDNILSTLLTGKYYQGIGINNRIDFYVVKGIMEELLFYLGYPYELDTNISIKELHPGVSANIIVSNEKVGFLGKIHPSIYKEDIYVMEINLTKLLKNKVDKLKYISISKYPSITKDLAFIVSNDIMALDIVKTITDLGGKYLKNVDIFDVYVGDKLESEKKSIAFTLTFESSEKTLTDGYIKDILDKIITGVTTKHQAILRDN